MYSLAWVHRGLNCDSSRMLRSARPKQMDTPIGLLMKQMHVSLAESIGNIFLTQLQLTQDVNPVPFA